MIGSAACFVCPIRSPQISRFCLLASIPKGLEGKKGTYKINISSASSNRLCLKFVPAVKALSCFARLRNVPWKISDRMELTTLQSVQQPS